MKKMHPVLLALLIFTATMQAQTTDTITGKTDAKATKDKKSPLFGIVFSGYVKTDFIFDSRQTVNSREGHFLLFPENEKPDEDGTDINAKANFNILSIQTRLAGSITGPDAWCKDHPILKG